VWSGGQLGAGEELLASNFVGHMPGRASLEKASYLAEVGAFRRGFPDLQLKILSQFADGDRVVTEFRAAGTHGGKILGIPATRKPIGFGGLALTHVEEGRIVEHWDEWDRRVWLEQVGAVPSISML
jgi:predicted ester cyclase